MRSRKFYWRKKETNYNVVINKIEKEIEILFTKKYYWFIDVSLIDWCCAIGCIEKWVRHNADLNYNTRESKTKYISIKRICGVWIYLLFLISCHGKT